MSRNDLVLTDQVANIRRAATRWSQPLLLLHDCSTVARIPC